MRRKSDTNPFSLFAFQDIITAVTGIVLLLVILLSLCLVQLPDAEGSPEVSNTDSQTLTNEIQEVRERLQLLQELPTDPLDERYLLTEDQLKQELRKQQALKRQLENEKRMLAANLNDLQEVSTKLSEKLNSNPIVAKIKRLNQKTSQLEKRLGKLKESNRRLYNFRDVSARAPWIIDLSKSRTLIGSSDSEQSKVVFDDQNPTVRIEKMSNWLSQNASNKDYFVLIVRAGTVTTYRAVRKQLEATGAKIGIDVVGPNVTVLEN